MVSESWGRAISGPVLAVVAIFLAVLQQTITDAPTAATALKIGTWATFGIAVFMILVAQYEVWKRELEKREAEEAKNQRPELRGRVFNFNVSAEATGIDHDEYSTSGQIQFEIEVCNYRSIPTNITGLSLDGSKIDDTLTFYDIAFTDSPPSLQQGIAHRFAGSAFASIRRPKPSVEGQWARPKYVDLDTLIVTLTDGFGVRHQIKSNGGAIF